VSAEQAAEGPRRILVGYDGSGGARDAVALCRVLATAGAERTLLVHVLHHPGAPSIAYRRLSGAEQPPREDFFAAAVAELSGLEVETRAYVGGSPARVLNDLAEEGQCDLIVVGSPRRDRLGGVLLGSVARGLLHGAPIPIATAPPGYAAGEHVRLGKIAVGYDATEESRAALHYAEALARQAGAGIEVLTVERPRNPPIGALEYTLRLPEDPKPILEQARHELDPGLEVGARVLTGTTAAALSEACESGVDLLCVGSRGYGTAARVLLGSVSTQLVREAPSPLLIVPRP
jgi:nucleotide-binding universal stress UspA family protein